ncbi:hypothetical protein PYW07_005696 [Mythimna separata]|uniref:Uncharacterized protein n=1 Tax=Mythimna separata TaxID=271217 RepID=A0AAD8DRJ0_MYTSE|nr:hypothetical protein PYW07_005696 [Mythimna separata]
MTKDRGAKTKKSFISIFICMSTKTVHLELVGDLTSAAFIAAFQRFVSHRGRCIDFVRVNKLLAVTRLRKETLNSEITCPIYLQLTVHGGISYLPIARLLEASERRE